MIDRFWKLFVFKVVFSRFYCVAFFTYNKNILALTSYMLPSFGYFVGYIEN